MSRLAAIARRVFVLRARHALLIAVPAFALMIHALTTGLPSALAWPLYAASAYALAVIVLAMGVYMVARANRALRALRASSA